MLVCVSDMLVLWCMVIVVKETAHQEIEAEGGVGGVRCVKETGVDGGGHVGGGVVFIRIISEDIILPADHEATRLIVIVPLVGTAVVVVLPRLILRNKGLFSLHKTDFRPLSGIRLFRSFVPCWHQLGVGLHSAFEIIFLRVGSVTLRLLVLIGSAVPAYSNSF